MAVDTGRFWEIDFLRGIAVCMMLIYHSLMDLEFMKPGLYLTDALFWACFQKLTATLFLLLAGLSLSIRYARRHPSFYIFSLRGLKIFGWGCLITIVTKLVLPEGYVVFGILHLIGLSTIMAYPLFYLKKTNLIIGLSSIVAGIYLNRLSFPSTSLVWIGLTPNYFYSIDYFPLFPWFGLFTLGIFIGQISFAEGHPISCPESYSFNPAVRFITMLGRHTLPIYIMHQPIILAAIYLYFLLTKIPV